MKNAIRLLTCAAVFGLAACEDTMVPGELSETDAEELASVIMASMFSNSGGVPGAGAAANGPQLVPFEFMSDIEVTAPCPLGGEVAIDGSATIAGDTETEETSVSYEVTHTHNACVAEGAYGNQFTVTGSPNLSFDFVAEIEGMTVSWDGSVSGGVMWAVDGMEGTCNVSYEFSGSATGEQDVSANVTGTVCGYSIQQSLTIG